MSKRSSPYGKNATTAPAYSMTTCCATPGCSYRNLHQDFGPTCRYCCSACYRREGVHTRFCSGSGHLVVTSDEPQPPSTPPPPPTPPPVFKLPVEWCRCERTIFEFIGCYITKYSDYLTLNDVVYEKWRAFATVMGNQIERHTLQREITLYAFAEEEWQRRVTAGLHVHVLNVHDRGVNGRAPFSFYAMREVTGLDFRLQGFLLTQPVTVDVLSEAVSCIVMNDLCSYAFVCSHGTHRSVGCCVLLTMLAFPRARIVLTTPRTQADARRLGLQECSGSRSDA